MKLSKDDWSEFWENPVITTFVGRFENNYDQEFKQFWHDVFDAVPRNSRVLDLACGNGALALLADNYSKEKGLNYEVIGVDFSDIKPEVLIEQFPEKYKNLKNIHFLKNTNIENIPLDPSTCNLFISQYGFEYADFENAVDEVVRLSNEDGAVLALIVHAENSSIITQAQESLDQINICFNQVGLHKRILQLLKHLNKTELLKNLQNAKFDPKAEKLRKKINSAINQINNKIEHRDDTKMAIFIMAELMGVFQRTTGLSYAQKIKQFNSLTHEIQTYKARMSDLLNAAIPHNTFLEYCNYLTESGFSLTKNEKFYYGNTFMGYSLIGRLTKK